MARESASRLTAKVKSTERRLALEIRSWKFGYVVIQGCELLDWGVCRFPRGDVTVAIRKFSFLLTTYVPSIVITKRTRRAKHRSAPKATHLLQAFRRELKAQSIPFAILRRADVRDYFIQQGCTSKDGVARIVAERFDRLKSRIPRSRKPWDPERSMVAVFDAAATAIAFENLRAPEQI